MPVTIKKGAVELSDVPLEPVVKQQPFADLPNAAAAASAYLQYGMQPVPVPLGEKAPKVAWPNFQCAQATISNQFAGSANIAIKLGEPSGGVVDVDLDTPEAAALAPHFLSETKCVFGRQSKPASHHVYRAIGPVSSLKRQAIVGGSSAVLLELRSTNLLTIFPPSVHPSGEKVRFEDGKAGIPTPVAAEDLTRRVSLLAAAALIARVWPEKKGFRHDLAMALAGGMLRMKLPEDLTKQIIVRAATVAKDEEAAARGKVVGTTLNKIKQGEKVTGWPSVAELLDEIGSHVVKKCIAWLEAAGYPAAPETITTPTMMLNTQLVSEIQAKPIKWLWLGWIASGAVSVLDGDPGMGKSTIGLHLAACISAGGVFPDGTKCTAASVLILSGEDSAASTIKPRLAAAKADLTKIRLIWGVKDKNGVESMFSIPEHISAIRKEIVDTGAKFVLIDPFVICLSSTVHVHNDQQVRQALMPLAQIAEETGAAFLTVRHLNKQDGKKALYRGGGSIGIIGAARTAMVVGADPLDANYRILAVSKSNIGPVPPSWRYKIVGCSYPDGDTTIDTNAVEWLGPADISADQLVSEGVEQKTSAVGEAKDFLTDTLKDGPMMVAEVAKLAQAEGISIGTLRRAMKKLGIVKSPVHDGKKITGWMCSLASHGSAPAGSNGGTQVDGAQP